MLEKENMVEEQSKISAENLKKFAEHKFSYKKTIKKFVKILIRLQ